jgi:GxxExxY protein
MTADELNALSKQVLDAAYRVHSVLGPGMLESAYVACMVHELRKAGLKVRTEVPVPVVYEGVKLADVGYRMDLLVEDELVVEVKSVDTLAPVHHAQLISYLKLSNRRIGLLLNFNAARLSEGISRKVNRF